ncbi:MAG: hypothetical protein HZA19_01955 [Nitrospirae bacterium]|nr:hypothetical protein [Nitrospirota bacterium]
MKEIQIKSSHPEKAVPLLKDAIERERKLILHSISITQTKIDRLASSLKVNIPALLQGKTLRTPDNEQDLLDLEGELALLQHLKEELSSLEELQVCP